MKRHTLLEKILDIKNFCDTLKMYFFINNILVTNF